MDKLYLKPVPSLTGNNVIVPKEVWTALVRYLDEVHTAVNNQASEIVKLTNDVATSNKNIATIARAVGGLYNEE